MRQNQFIHLLLTLILFTGIIFCADINTSSGPQPAFKQANGESEQVFEFLDYLSEYFREWNEDLREEPNN